MTQIQCNVGVAFIEDDKLLLITNYPTAGLNIKLHNKLHNKYQFCFEIDLLNIQTCIDKITHVVVDHTLIVILLRDNTTFISGRLGGIFLSNWTNFKFTQSIENLTIHDPCFCILDTDDDIWICEKFIYNHVENYCEFANILALDKQNCDIVDSSVELHNEYMILTRDSGLFTYQKNNENYIYRQYFNYLQLVKISNNNSNNYIVLLDVNGKAYECTNNSLSIVECDYDITDVSVLSFGLFLFVSDNKLFMKSTTIVKLEIIPDDLEIIQLLRTSYTNFVVTTGGIIFILDYLTGNVIKKRQIQTDHDFTPIKQIKSAAKI